MRRSDRRSTPKRRTRGHVIADLAVNYVERQVLRCGHVIERTTRDYGIDLTMQVYDAAGRREHGDLYMQVKATDKVVRLRRTGEIALPVERGDVEWWLRSLVPVVPGRPRSSRSSTTPSGTSRTGSSCRRTSDRLPHSI